MCFIQTLLHTELLSTGNPIPAPYQFDIWGAQRPEMARPVNIQEARVRERLVNPTYGIHIQNLSS